MCWVNHVLDISAIKDMYHTVQNSVNIDHIHELSSVEWREFGILGEPV